MKIILIASVSENLVIAKQGKIPWSNKADLAHFKETTICNTVLMGRKTYESIGKILPERLNLVLTKNPKALLRNKKSLEFLLSIDEAISYAKQKKYGDLFIIGGGEIFQQTIKFADELIISHFPVNVQGDTYFPLIDGKYWYERKRLQAETFHVSYYSKRN